MNQPVRITERYSWTALHQLLHDSFAYMEARINPPSSLHRLTPEAIEAFAATQYLYVIEAGSTPIACMFATDKDEFLYLGKIAVSAEYRDRGLAGVLMTQAEETARDLGFNRLRLESRIELTEVHATFASFGFTKVGETAHPGYDRPTSIIMEKVLT